MRTYFGLALVCSLVVLGIGIWRARQADEWADYRLTWPERWWLLRGTVEYRFLRPLACAVLGHDWCGWDTLEHGPGGRRLEYRVCDRCAELEESAELRGAGEPMTIRQVMEAEDGE